MGESAGVDDGLGTVLSGVWRALEDGVSSAKHGFHLPVLATVGADGSPEARTVVLRGVDPETRAVWCHTDVRSPKVEALGGGAAASWVFYDRAMKLQARVGGWTRVKRDGELADRAWASSGMSSRRCYLAPVAPGTRTAGPDPNLPESVRGRVPEEGETAAGRVQFGVVVTRVRSIDVLSLAHDGHRRAVFGWDDAGVLSASWAAV